jgi:hypothetical protein
MRSTGRNSVLNVRGVLHLVLLLALPSGLAACSDPEPTLDEPAVDPPLPMMIHGMPVVEVTVGEEANRLIGRLHGQDVAPLNSYVGEYRGGGAAATLYVSRMADSTVADLVVRRTAEAIGSGSQEFAHHTRFRIDDLVVHAVLGEGQAHFFYAWGSDVTWLGVDLTMARVSLAALLGLEARHLPNDVVLHGVDLLPQPDSLYRRRHPPPRNPSTAR